MCLKKFKCPGSAVTRRVEFEQPDKSPLTRHPCEATTTQVRVCGLSSQYKQMWLGRVLVSKRLHVNHMGAARTGWERGLAVNSLMGLSCSTNVDAALNVLLV